MAGVDVFCWGCAARGTVNKVTANLHCSCGSNDVDLWDGGQDQLHRVAAVNVQQPVELSFADFMTKQAAPSTLPGWNEYAGPMPGKNPMSSGERGPFEKGGTCPVCHGSGFDIHEGGPCRECGGSGKLTPETTPEPPAVARHNYPSTQTKVPFMGQRRVAQSPEDWLTQNVPDYGVTPRANATEFPRADSHSPHVRNWSPMDYQHENKPLPLPDAHCPTCGNGNTSLQRDYKDDAWWTCPSCGPLVNVDRKGVNPFAPGDDFVPNGRSFKSAKRLFSGKKTGTLLARIAVIAKHNPGLYPREVIGLAINSVRKYSEAR